MTTSLPTTVRLAVPSLPMEMAGLRLWGGDAARFVTSANRVTLTGQLDGFPARFFWTETKRTVQSSRGCTALI